MTTTSPSCSETIIPSLSSLMQKLSGNVREMDDSLHFESIDLASSSTLVFSGIEKANNSYFTLSVTCLHQTSDCAISIEAQSLLLEITKCSSFIQALENVKRRANG